MAHSQHPSKQRQKRHVCDHGFIACAKHVSSDHVAVTKARTRKRRANADRTHETQLHRGRVLHVETSRHRHNARMRHCSQHAADEDNRHATLARTQLTATKHKRRVPSTNLPTPRQSTTAWSTVRTARASGHPPTPRRKPIETPQKSAPRTKFRRRDTLCKGIVNFCVNFQTSAALVSMRSISVEWASHPRRG